jgi:hypothetical protein
MQVRPRYPRAEPGRPNWSELSCCRVLLPISAPVVQADKCSERDSIVSRAKTLEAVHDHRRGRVSTHSDDSDQFDLALALPASFEDLPAPGCYLCNPPRNLPDVSGSPFVQQTLSELANPVGCPGNRHNAISTEKTKGTSVDKTTPDFSPAFNNRKSRRTSEVLGSPANLVTRSGCPKPTMASSTDFAARLIWRMR